MATDWERVRAQDRWKRYIGDRGYARAYCPNCQRNVGVNVYGVMYRHTLTGSITSGLCIGSNLHPTNPLAQPGAQPDLPLYQLPGNSTPRPGAVTTED